MMESSSTEVKMATPRNMMKRSPPIRWKLSSSSWSVTRTAGRTKPRAMPSY